MARTLLLICLALSVLCGNQWVTERSYYNGPEFDTADINAHGAYIHAYDDQDYYQYWDDYGCYDHDVDVFMGFNFTYTPRRDAVVYMMCIETNYEQRWNLGDRPNYESSGIMAMGYYNASTGQIFDGTTLLITPRLAGRRDLANTEFINFAEITPISDELIDDHYPSFGIKSRFDKDDFQSAFNGRFPPSHNSGTSPLTCFTGIGESDDLFGGAFTEAFLWGWIESFYETEGKKTQVDYQWNVTTYAEQTQIWDGNWNFQYLIDYFYDCTDELTYDEIEMNTSDRAVFKAWQEAAEACKKYDRELDSKLMMIISVDEVIEKLDALHWALEA